MTLILGSAFLAGAVLSCVLPIALLIAMVTWYVQSVRRVPPSVASGHRDAPSSVPPAEPPDRAGSPDGA